MKDRDTNPIMNTPIMGETTRRKFLKAAGMLGVSCLSTPLLSYGTNSYGRYDTIIRNGTIFDGTLAEPRMMDVGILADKIVAVGNLSGPAEKVIDARNCIVTPGFIDVHDHSDIFFAMLKRELARTMPVWSGNHAAVIQGVTTVLSGNCGYGFTDMNEYYTFLDSLPFGSNTYYLTPHGYLRNALFGGNQPGELTSAQLERFKAKVAEEMEKGALGMSTGLAYDPGYLATKQELIELAKVIKRYGGIYVSHARHDGPEAVYGQGNKDMMDGFKEAIDVGRQAGVPVQISHIKGFVPCEADVPDKILQTIADARREGIDVTADQYPYTSGATVISVLVPSKFRTATGIKTDYWTEPGKTELKQAIEYTLRYLSADKVLVNGYKDYPILTMQQIADEKGLSPAELFLEIVCTDKVSGGIFFFTDETSMEKLMKSEYIFTASDSGSMPEQTKAEHPRWTGTFARKLRVYAMDRGLLTLQQAILSMTSRPAEKFGLKGRGKIAAGYYADIAVIDPVQLRDISTYQTPYLYAQGVHHVLVNGILELENGVFTGLRSGRALRRS